MGLHTEDRLGGFTTTDYPRRGGLASLTRQPLTLPWPLAWQVLRPFRLPSWFLRKNHLENPRLPHPRRKILQTLLKEMPSLWARILCPFYLCNRHKTRAGTTLMA